MFLKGGQLGKINANWDLFYVIVNLIRSMFISQHFWMVVDLVRLTFINDHFLMVVDLVRLTFINDHFIMVVDLVMFASDYFWMIVSLVKLTLITHRFWVVVPWVKLTWVVIVLLTLAFVIDCCSGDTLLHVPWADPWKWLQFQVWHLVTGLPVVWGNWVENACCVR